MLKNNYTKPNKMVYSCFRFMSWILNKFKFGTKYETNEIKNKKGPFVVLANHEMALDIFTLINSTKRNMTIVMSKSFQETLPFNKSVKKMGMISKQQFMTTPVDIIKMISVIKNGGVLLLFPSGIMTEDGLPTPTPESTYRFLKKLGSDIYVAKLSNTYFLNPKWSKGIKKGKCFVNIKKVLSKEELKSFENDKIKQIISNELDFDVYKEQEKRMIKYKGIDNLAGLENVLYQCPHCFKEYSISTSKNLIYCDECGFEHYCDKFGFLHQKDQSKKEFRYIYQWNRFILDEIKKNYPYDEEMKMEEETDIYLVNHKNHKYEKFGEGKVSFYFSHIHLEGTINGESITYDMPLKNVPILPFSPGKHLEIQTEDFSYRLVFKDKRKVMKMINLIKYGYEIDNN